MRALIERYGWVEVEESTEAAFWLGRRCYTVVDDPEAGTFTEEEIEEIEA